MVHALIEERRTQFVLTGSSARKLKRSGVDMLAGRAALRFLFPYLAAEMGDQFSLASALRIGLIPLIVAAKGPDDALRAYVSLYVREEVFQDGLVRNMAGFSRFLEAVSFSHGQVLNRRLKAFKADYPEATCNLVYAGRDRLLIEDVLCLPAEEFLRGLRLGP